MFSESIVVGVAAAIDGAVDAGFGEALGVADGEKLDAPVRVVDQSACLVDAARVDCDLQRIERSPGSARLPTGRVECRCTRLLPRSTVELGHEEHARIPHDRIGTTERKRGQTPSGQRAGFVRKQAQNGERVRKQTPNGWVCPKADPKRAGFVRTGPDPNRTAGWVCPKGARPQSDSGLGLSERGQTPIGHLQVGKWVTRTMWADVRLGSGPFRTNPAPPNHVRAAPPSEPDASRGCGPPRS